MPSLAEYIEPERIEAILLAFLPKVLAALIIVIAFWAFFRISRKPIAAVLRRARVHDALVHLLVDNVYRFTLILFSVLMAASQLGVNVAAALAGIGVIGIALGLAAQDTAANMISGFLIFWDKPFAVGDYLTTAEHYGEVREITIRTTRIRTMENTFVVVPNRQIMDSILVNHSMYGSTRLNVPVGIAYKENIPEARAVLLETVRSVEGVLEHPGPEVVVERLAGSSADLSVRVWIDDMSQAMSVSYRTLEACKLALDAARIQIPYPHLQLFVENVDDQVWDRIARLPVAASAGRQRTERKK
jgi:small-conductance mechanosensitive channel